MVTQRAEPCNMTLNEMEVGVTSPQEKAHNEPDLNVPSTSISVTPIGAGPELTRYLPPNKSEAFIGPLLTSVEETVTLVKRECPSLRDIPPSDITFSISFDKARSTAAVTGANFRLTSEAWPKGIHQVLPIVIVGTICRTQIQGSLNERPTQTLEVSIEDQEQDDSKVVSTGMQDATKTRTLDTNVQASKGDPSGPTWDDLVKQGGLLGIHGGPNIAPLSSLTKTPEDVLRQRGGGTPLTWKELVKQGATLGIHGGPNIGNVGSLPRAQEASGVPRDYMVIPTASPLRRGSGGQGQQSGQAVTWEAMRKGQVVLGGHC